MPAPRCLQWAGALTRPPEWMPCKLSSERREARILINVLMCLFVIMLTVPFIRGDECMMKKAVPGDGASRALLAPQVLEAVLEEKIPPAGSVYEAVFRVVRVYKRYRGPGRLKRHRNVTLPFLNPRGYRGSAIKKRKECFFSADLKIRQKYFLFLSGASSRHESISSIAPPLPFSRKMKKRIKSVICPECAKAPVVGRLSDDSVVRGQPVNLTCTFEGVPSPVVTWLKEGRLIVPLSNKNIRIHTHKFHRKVKTRHRTRKKGPHHRRIVQVISTLEFRSSRDSDSAVYTCVGKSLLGEASAKATLTVVPPIDPGIVYPCPYDSYCLNGGTCMFFKHFGEFVCQCPEGYKGQRCQEKEVFPSFRNHNCRSTLPYFSSSRGLRCPRNQPIFMWEILQQGLAKGRFKISPWTIVDHLTWTPTYISGSPANRFNPSYSLGSHFHRHKPHWKELDFANIAANYLPSQTHGTWNGQIQPENITRPEFVSPLLQDVSLEQNIHSLPFQGLINQNVSKLEPSPNSSIIQGFDSIRTNNEILQNYTTWLKTIGQETAVNLTSSKYSSRYSGGNKLSKQGSQNNSHSLVEDHSQRISSPSIRPSARHSYIYPTSVSTGSHSSTAD